MIVNVKDLPQEIRSALKRLGYRKHKAILSLCTGVEIYGTQWDGGSRHEYTLFDAAGTPCNRLYQSGTWMKPEQTERHLNATYPMVIEAGTFCGKPGTAYIYIHPRYWGAINV